MVDKETLFTEVGLPGDGMGLPVFIPIIIARGVEEGPAVGLTAAVHGNELKKSLLAFFTKRLQFSQHLNGFFVCFCANLSELVDNYIRIFIREHTVSFFI